MRGVGDLLELLVEIVGEILFQGILEGVAELFARATQRLPIDLPRLGDMIASGLVFLAAGGLAGYYSSRLLPHRILPHPRVSGLSVLLAPPCAGLAMHFLGRGGDVTAAIRPLWQPFGEAPFLHLPWRFGAGC